MFTRLIKQNTKPTLLTKATPWESVVLSYWHKFSLLYSSIKLIIAK